MNTKTRYSQYMHGEGRAGSNKAASYIRALELLGPILAKTAQYSDCSDVFGITSPQRVADLYEYVLEQQRLENDGIFGGQEPSSYWRNRFFSAALKSFQEYLIISPYQQQLWALVKSGKDPAILSQQLSAAEIGPLANLIPERGVDYSSREGKEILRAVKTRVNQDFFRDMILAEYSEQCCVTGLNVPGVLRASHIVGWAEDEANRLNPANGICLSATYDAAFDRHLISFDDDCRMVLSPVLKDFYGNRAFQAQFVAYEGQRIAMPKRFCPDREFLEKHRGKMPR